MPAHFAGAVQPGSGGEAQLRRLWALWLDRGRSLVPEDAGKPKCLVGESGLEGVELLSGEEYRILFGDLYGWSDTAVMELGRAAAAAAAAAGGGGGGGGEEAIDVEGEEEEEEDMAAAGRAAQAAEMEEDGINVLEGGSSSSSGDAAPSRLFPAPLLQVLPHSDAEARVKEQGGRTALGPGGAVLCAAVRGLKPLGKGGEIDGALTAKLAEHSGTLAWAVWPPLCALCCLRNVEAEAGKSAKFTHRPVTFAEVPVGQGVPGAVGGAGGAGAGAGGAASAASAAAARKTRSSKSSGKGACTFSMSSSDPLATARYQLLQQRDDPRALSAKFFLPASGDTPLDASLTLASLGILAGSTVYYRMGGGEAEDGDFGDAAVARGVERGFTGSRFSSAAGGGGGGGKGAGAGGAGAGGAGAGASEKGGGAGGGAVVVVEAAQGKGKAPTPSPPLPSPAAAAGGRAKGWTCPTCTFVNTSSRKGQPCEMCSGK